MAWEKTAGAGAIWWYRDGDLRRSSRASAFPTPSASRPTAARATMPTRPSERSGASPSTPATGLPVGEPKLYFQAAEADFWPDGAVVDADGLVWNARWGMGAVVAMDADGREVKRIAVPAQQSSCPAFLPDGGSW